MARGGMEDDDTQLIQFRPEVVHAEYHLSATAKRRQHPFSSNATVELEGSITFADRAKITSCRLTVYGDSEDLAQRASERRELLGSGGVQKGLWVGAVSVPDRDFASLVTMALSGMLQCVSLHSRKGASHGWLVTSVGFSTRPEI